MVELATFDPALVGRWSPPGSFRVTTEQVRAYAAATNDENPWHRSGRLAPPAFAAVPAIEVYPSLIEQLFGRSLADMGSVHGGHSLQVAVPLEPGMVLATRAAVVSVLRKRSGTVVSVRTESRDQSGRLVNTQRPVQFLRGFGCLSDAGEPPEPLGDEHRVGAATVRWLHVDDDQAVRYAEASGDFGDYTLSDEAARAAGFDRPILHGVCALALACRALVAAACDEDPRRLREVGVRFSAPLFPGSDVAVEIRRAAVPGRYVFAMTDRDGRAVLTGGHAAVEAG